MITIHRRINGGFRWPWLARLTNGRFGLGSWTVAEVTALRAEAKRRAAEFADVFEEQQR